MRLTPWYFKDAFDGLTCLTGFEKWISASGSLREPLSPCLVATSLTVPLGGLIPLQWTVNLDFLGDTCGCCSSSTCPVRVFHLQPSLPVQHLKAQWLNTVSLIESGVTPSLQLSHPRAGRKATAASGYILINPTWRLCAPSRIVLATASSVLFLMLTCVYLSGLEELNYLWPACC